MDVQQPRKIRNEHFKTLCDVIQEVIGEYLPSGSEVLSNMIEASVDDHDDEKIHLYNEQEMNLEIIKPDSLTKHLKNILKKPVREVPAADALCIDANNEWYIIEFKNSEITTAKESIRKKMLSTIWFVGFLYSKSQHELMYKFNGDLVEFARNHITYIIVCSSQKNAQFVSNIREKAHAKQSFTPRDFEQFIGYYFKDIRMITEKELRLFIHDFKN